MPQDIIKKGLGVLMIRQTNIISAAFVIMVTVLLSQVLGLFRERLLVSIFGASNTLGVYLASTRLPDFLFQIIVAGALSSAFIPVFSDFIEKKREKDAFNLASALLTIGLSIFVVLSIILFIFADFFLELLNPGSGFSKAELNLMANLMRIILFGQLLFIIGSFFSALLQSYNHFFIAGFAASLYNFGIIIGIITLSPYIGIYSAPFGVVLGALIYILVQTPIFREIKFSFSPIFSLRTEGVSKVLKLMWPRTLSIAIYQIGALFTVSFVSYLSDAGRNYTILNYAQTLMFAPIALFGQTIAQAAFPVLSREKDRLEDFKLTFMTSFNQMLYLVLPVSVLILVLRIPIVRLVFGAAQFDWDATVLTGRTLAFFSISIFAQALITLVSRGFYALHNTFIPLVAGSFSTIIMIVLSFMFIVPYGMGVESLALSYSIASIIHLLLLLILLDKKVRGFDKTSLILSMLKFFLASFFTALALYIPIKLLDRLVVDTTRTIGLIFLTGISSFAGLTCYLFLTWLLDIKEAYYIINVIKRLGDWRNILRQIVEPIDGSSKLNP